MIIHESESLTCYDCFSLFDGNICTIGGSSSKLRIIDCPAGTTCYSWFGIGKKKRSVF